MYINYCLLSHIVVPYNPDNKISVSAVLKLELHYDIKVLTRLGLQLYAFKDRAGFSMLPKPLPMADLYDVSLAANNIMNWVDDNSPSLPPTWRSFLQILREPGMNLSDIADQIESLLLSTTENQQHPVLEHNGEC